MEIDLSDYTIVDDIAVRVDCRRCHRFICTLRTQQEIRAFGSPTVWLCDRCRRFAESKGIDTDNADDVARFFRFDVARFIRP